MINKLVVISIDALVREDINYLETKPNFSNLLARSAQVREVTSVFPTLTYPCHTVQMTGQTIDKIGVNNNEQFDTKVPNPDWTWYYDLIQVETIFDIAKKIWTNYCSICLASNCWST